MARWLVIVGFLAGCDRGAPEPAVTTADAAPPAAPAEAPPAGAVPAEAAPKDDLTKPGTYTSGRWSYTLAITAAGSRSEGERGILRFDGNEVPPAVAPQFYETPWGDIVYLGEPEVLWGRHGWFLREGPREGAPVTTPLPPPG